jgi:xylulokinase
VTLLLGIDVGTTSIKAVVYRPDGIAVASASLPTPTHVPRPRWAYYRPHELWDTVVSVIRRALEHVPDPRQIASVAVASVAESGVLLDAAGQPTTDSIAWFDTRTQPQAEWLAARVGQDALFARTGLSLQPIFSLNKLLWHRQHEPEAWARSVRWLLLADYIAFRLCGEGATDLSLASRTLMLNLHERRWDVVTLAEAEIDPDLLAPLVPGGTALGKVTAAAAEATGLNSLGTAEAIFLPIAEPLTDPQAGRQGYSQGAHVAGGGYYVFAGQYTSGASIDWLRQLLGTQEDPVAYDRLISGAAKVPAGSLGAMFLPHLRLANPPYDDPRSRGALIGLTTDIGNDAVARAVFEGLAFETLGTYEPLGEYRQVVAPRSVVAIGGGTKNALLMGIKASVSNLPHEIIDAQEATALGAALLGALGAGVFSDVEEARSAMRYGQHVVDPNPADVPIYRSLYEKVYKRFYPALAPLSQTISDLQTVTVAEDDE